MGILGTSNGAISKQIDGQNQSTFKTVNNLLTLQENHVEEFFQYHGEEFFYALEKLIEDVVQREVSGILSKLQLINDNSSGKISVTEECLSEYNKITQENIDLDITNLLATAVNSEVVMQRKMAKSQYLESQGFSQGSQPQMQQPIQQPTQQPTNIQGQPQMGMANQNMGNIQGAVNNQSGYPIPPSGYDNYNNPYWIDPATGQATYAPPSSGMHLMEKAGKVAAWAKWLA